MTDSVFWKLADAYEKIDHRGKPYVPMKNVKDLSVDILTNNNYNKAGSLEDFNLFNFKRKEKALQIFNSVCKLIGKD